MLHDFAKKSGIRDSRIWLRLLKRFFVRFSRCCGIKWAKSGTEKIEIFSSGILTSIPLLIWVLEALTRQKIDKINCIHLSNLAWHNSFERRSPPPRLICPNPWHASIPSLLLGETRERKSIELALVSRILISFSFLFYLSLTKFASYVSEGGIPRFRIDRPVSSPISHRCRRASELVSEGAWRSASECVYSERKIRGKKWMKRTLAVTASEGVFQVDWKIDAKNKNRLGKSDQRAPKILSVW